MLGPTAVCRHSLRNGAFRRLLASFLVSRLRQPTLCTFSAPLSPQVICWMSGPADKLSLPVADARARSGECVRAAVASMGSCELFNPGLFRLSVEFCGDFYMAAGRCAAKQRLTELTSGVVVLKLCISCHNQQPSPAEVATSSDLRSILFHLGVRV